MLAHPHITKIIAVVMAAAVCLCLCAVVFSDRLAEAAGGTGISMEYETALFDTDSILRVNILMEDADWSDMLANAAAEDYYQCDVEINGTTFYRVGIRPKGNTSLTSIASDPTTDRYSFKLEFDHYVEGQTCFGLDKLVLNNNYADATSMKEALIYDMYQYLGADASLYNYASISVNGEYWGVYLALEAVEDSFLLRSCGVQNGALYKPDSMNPGGGFDAADRDRDGTDPSGRTPPDRQETGDPPETPQFPSQQANESSERTAGAPADFGARPEMRFDFAGGMSGGGADLNYTDDALNSYETIWDGAVTSTKKSDRQRVVTALKNISEGKDLEDFMDIDNLLRYMAVHVFSVNEDSLSGSMAHNYYLYESDGRLNLIPWDYNLALGGMGGGTDATAVVNDAIDNAFSGTSFFDTLMADETYHSQYYAYLRQLVSEYISGGGFDAFYTRVRSQIDALVETDPTAFYTASEYQAAAETLYQVVKLRGESILAQLEGTIPSTEAARDSSTVLVDASALDLSVMGSMNGGGRAVPAADAPGSDAAADGDDRTFSAGDPTDTPAAPPSDADSEQSGSATPGQRGGPPDPADGMPGDSADGNGSPSGGSSSADDSADSGASAAPPSFPGGRADSTAQTAVQSNLALYGAAFAVLLAVMLFSARFRRRH